MLNKFNYEDMTEIEKREFESKLIYAIRRSKKSFNLAIYIIEYAGREGVFKNLKMGAPNVYGEKQ